MSDELEDAIGDLITCECCGLTRPSNSNVWYLVKEIKNEVIIPDEFTFRYNRRHEGNQQFNAILERVFERAS